MNKTAEFFAENRKDITEYTAVHGDVLHGLGAYIPEGQKVVGAGVVSGKFQQYVELMVSTGENQNGIIAFPDLSDAGRSSLLQQVEKLGVEVFVPGAVAEERAFTL